jgi:hypothetical protein
LQKKPVRVVDPGLLQWTAQLADLVSGGEDRYPQAPPDGHGSEAERGEKAEVLRAEAAASLQHARAERHVLPARTAGGAGVQSSRQGDAAALLPHVLLHEHRVESLRHRRPVKMRTAAPRP